MDEAAIRAQLKNVKCFLLDMDGTFYLGDNLIEGSLDFLAALKRTGRTARFLTNNSSKSASVYAAKLTKMNVPEEYRDVISSGHAAARYCLKNFPGKKGYQIVEAEVPSAEMADYTVALRAISGGKGSFTFYFERYEEAPGPVAQKIIEEAKKNEEA